MEIALDRARGQTTAHEVMSCVWRAFDVAELLAMATRLQVPMSCEQKANFHAGC